MKKIILSFLFLATASTMNFAYGYTDYNSCSQYYSHKNDTFCYNKYTNNTNINNIYNSCSNNIYSSTNCGVNTNLNLNYNNLSGNQNNAFYDYNSCKSYYNNGNDAFCQNYYYGNWNNNSNYYDYNSCRIYYNYNNDTLCLSQFNNVYYSNGSNYNNNVNFYDYNSCRIYYNYNNDALCNSYYYGISNTFYTDYNSCSKYFNNNNNNFCTNRYYNTNNVNNSNYINNNKYNNYKTNNSYNNYNTNNSYNNNSNYNINRTRTGEDNYWNMIYMNGLNSQYTNSPSPDYFTKNVIGGANVDLDKFNNTNILNFNLTNPVNQNKYNAATNFVNALKQEIQSRYQNGTISYDKMNDIINDFSYYVYYTNLYIESLRNIEQGKNIAQNQQTALDNLNKVKTFYDKLKFSLKNI